ncbi:hypothetical protein HK101_011439 [Irineochytrium annulatum]|nr:hypothetical protein HK101_011439 [Irineochytrium annulatum]
MTVSEYHRALVLQEDGSLKVEQVPVPTLEDDEVLIRVVCAAQNPVDWKLIDFKAAKPGDVVGCDVSGTIVSIGRNVDTAAFKIGDRVATFVHAARVPGEGGFSEHVRARHDLLLRLPDSVTHEEASTVPAACITAALGLSDARVDELAPGTPFLVWSAASSTGSFAVQLAKIKGLHVVATCSPRNEAYVRGLGADVIIDYTDAHVARKVQEAASAHGGLTRAYDAYSGGDSFALVESCLDADRPGHIATVMPGGEAAIKRADVSTTIVQGWNALGRPYTNFLGQVVDVNEKDFNLTRETYRKLTTMMEDGRIKPNRVRLLEGGLEAVAAGLEMMRAGKVSGEKIVYKI